MGPKPQQQQHHQGGGGGGGPPRYQDAHRGAHGGGAAPGGKKAAEAADPTPVHMLVNDGSNMPTSALPIATPVAASKSVPGPLKAWIPENETELSKQLQTGTHVVATLRVMTWTGDFAFGRCLSSAAMPVSGPAEGWNKQDVLLAVADGVGTALPEDIISVELYPTSDWEWTEDGEKAEVKRRAKLLKKEAAEKLRQEGGAQAAAPVEDSDDDDDNVAASNRATAGKSSSIGDGTEGGADGVVNPLETDTEILPDGRTMVHAVKFASPDSKAAANAGVVETSRVSADPVRKITSALKGPMNPAKTFAWPLDRKPCGFIAKVLQRRFERLHACRFVPDTGAGATGNNNRGVSPQVSQSTTAPKPQGSKITNPKRWFKMKPYNQAFPIMGVYGADIPQEFWDDPENFLYLVQIDIDEKTGEPFFIEGRFPKAKVVKSLGKSGTVQAESEAIAAFFEVSSPEFSEDVEACVMKNFLIPPVDEFRKEGRRDLRWEEFVTTIDPSTARDLDDALSITKLKPFRPLSINSNGSGSSPSTPNDATSGRPVITTPDSLFTAHASVPNAVYRVGVHIADVSYFVPIGSALDEEAKKRATSVYFVERVIPMLPHKLCEDYCSINGGVDKYAFSGIWEFDATGNVVSEWFGQSVIRNRCRMCYEDAQRIIDGDESGDSLVFKNEIRGEPVVVASADQKSLDLTNATVESFGGLGWTRKEMVDKVVTSVKLLWELGSILKRNRFARGALALNKSKMKFVFPPKTPAAAPTSQDGNTPVTSATMNPTVAKPPGPWKSAVGGTATAAPTSSATVNSAPGPTEICPVGYKLERSLEANNLVEEFMLHANFKVAEKVVEFLPDSTLLRKHDPPLPAKLIMLSQIAKTAGFNINTTSSKALADSVEALKDHPDAEAIRAMVTMCMQLAKYVCTGDPGEEEEDELDDVMEGAPRDKQAALEVMNKQLRTLKGQGVRVGGGPSPFGAGPKGLGKDDDDDGDVVVMTTGPNAQGGSVKSSKWRHYALAAFAYCHFTSPIRRYADLMTHRQLLLALDLEKAIKAQRGLRGGAGGVGTDSLEPVDVETDPMIMDSHRAFNYPPDQVEDIALNCNEKKEKARKAGDASSKLFLCMYLDAVRQKNAAMNAPPPTVAAPLMSIQDLERPGGSKGAPATASASAAATVPRNILGTTDWCVVCPAVVVRVKASSFSLSISHMALDCEVKHKNTGQLWVGSNDFDPNDLSFVIHWGPPPPQFLSNTAAGKLKALPETSPATAPIVAPAAKQQPRQSPALGAKPAPHAQPVHHGDVSYNPKVMSAAGMAPGFKPIEEDDDDDVVPAGLVIEDPKTATKVITVAVTDPAAAVAAPSGINQAFHDKHSTRPTRTPPPAPAGAKSAPGVVVNEKATLFSKFLVTLKIVSRGFQQVEMVVHPPWARGEQWISSLPMMMT